ncbi:MAG: amidohydrolase family protein [Deltaproteobacteria bacterium]|nr:amidohydrolase family protein [Deltaproteobacteria bacterium]MBI3078471.1 amidohydrolase family protein [Deltaproteobacteria bacterium]
MATFTVIDADSHVEEPTEAWAFLDERYAARKPFVVTAENRPILAEMNAFWYIDGRVFPRPVGRGTTVFGTPLAQVFAGKKRFSPGSQSLTDVEARVRDLDAAGIDLQVVFPSIFLEPLSDDVQFEAALMRSYNTWIGQACARRPDRLRWAAIMPMRHVPAAVEELRRAKALGAVGAALFGTVGETMLHDEAFDPFFAEAERLDMPIGVHAGWSHPGIQRSLDTLPGARALGFTLPSFLGFYSFLGAGILDRYPRLKVAFLEVGVEWVPYLVQRMDHYFHGDSQLGWPIPAKRTAREYLRECQVYFTCEAEEEFLPQAATYVGEDRLLFEADMPHAEARDNALHEIRGRVDLSDALKQKILHDNAVRFYGF